VTRRRWIAEHWDEATAIILGAQAEHMARVLRAQPGMEADVVAGGHVFHAQVAAVTPSEVRFNLIAEVQADPALPVTLVLSIYKFDHMEWALEKATELGVAAVAPVIARRTEKHLARRRRSAPIDGVASCMKRLSSHAAPMCRLFTIRRRWPSACEPRRSLRVSCLPSRNAPPRCATPSMRL